ncbi:unnamed protein product [Acanthoscelides obtectus]|uniref:Uncharacterized protein n=1 Tax=Acanthoscelides obtectus TaxID=200917 RepID=A0A9P0Q5K8_ACAOB|nr:unnamed protein product [Acanthoscelides obtectus]CAK1667129.1 hypothetical protein AOBTE_LOCUS25693 [Acanthoscelides obtectus]
MLRLRKASKAQDRLRHVTFVHQPKRQKSRENAKTHPELLL